MRNINPRVLVVPYPEQGHVIPLLELSHRLVKQGLNVTFVSTDFSHETVVKSLPLDHDQKSTIDDGHGGMIDMALIQCGHSLEDREEPGKLHEWVMKAMPSKVEELIEEINNNNKYCCDDHDGHEKIIGCVVADLSLGWAIDIAERKGIKNAAFCLTAVASLVQAFSIPRLIDEGLIDQNGDVLKKQKIKLSAEMPVMDTSKFAWTCLGDKDMQRNAFNIILKTISSIAKADRLICNSTYVLEPAALELAPQALPIGPLLSDDTINDHHQDHSSSSECLIKWLDQQRPRSVIYVAFGSFAVLDPTQLQELALGLELSNRPFLWVLRTTGGDFLNGFLERVGDRGRVVNDYRVPHQEVLRHSSVACFASHCEWDSVLGGVRNGLTFLCWPRYADQFVNESYLCDVWRVGLGFDRNDDDVATSEVMIGRYEIRAKVERVLDDDEMRERALVLKEMVLDSVKEFGGSTKNFKVFVEWIKSS